MKKLLLAFLGFPGSAGVKGYVNSLLSRGKNMRQSPLAAERRRFEEEVRGQFLKLKEKGLGIRVFTL